MCQRVLILVLTLTAASVRSSVAGTTTQSAQILSSWQRLDSPHFEVHYLRALAPELRRVIRSAERAYALVSTRLNFELATRTPLIVYLPSGPMTLEQIVAYASGNEITPPWPHRNRVGLPLPATDRELDALIVHELTHVLVSEIVNPGKGGGGGVPHWVREGIAHYRVGAWPAADERLMRELVVSGDVPALSQLTGSGGFANARLNGALGHAAFDYIESRWGPAGVRRFLDALLVPRVSRTYAAVFELTPEEFDAAFRQYAQRRFRRMVQ